MGLNWDRGFPTLWRCVKLSDMAYDPIALPKIEAEPLFAVGSQTWVRPGDSVLLDGVLVTYLGRGYGSLGYWHRVRHNDRRIEDVYETQRQYRPRWQAAARTV